PRAFVGRGVRDVVAVEADAAAGGEMRAGDGLEQRALARTVGPDQAVEGAGAHGDVNPAERLQRAEALLDVANLEKGRHTRFSGECLSALSVPVAGDAAPALFRRRPPYEPMRSRSETNSPRMPDGLNNTTSSRTTPRITGQYCLIAS